MKKQLKQVEIFQKAFGQNVELHPTLINENKAKLRYDLMNEENDEYLEAVENSDLVEVADALTDQLYILCGTILEHGMQGIIEKCFEEVQRSNMSKLDDTGLPIINGQNGVFDKTRPLGKILKSYNYSEPDLKQFIISPKKQLKTEIYENTMYNINSNTNNSIR
jgi:predicted HAD superfamily Cof-like phosphohydrolase